MGSSLPNLNAATVSPVKGTVTTNNIFKKPIIICDKKINKQISFIKCYFEILLTKLCFLWGRWNLNFAKHHFFLQFSFHLFTLLSDFLLYVIILALEYIYILAICNWVRLCICEWRLRIFYFTAIGICLW
jgi:hypothetical protein